MADFALAQAADGTHKELAAACVEQLRAASGHNLGFVYVTSPLARAFAEIVGHLRQHTGIADWVGTVGHGVCATGAEYFDTPAIVALSCRFDAGGYRIIPSVADASAVRPRAGAAFEPAIGIVHGDPRNPAASEIVAAVARHHGAYLVGGLSSADTAFPQAAGERVIDGGVSGVLLGGQGLQVHVGLTQGCSPIGPAHAVTAAQDQVLVTLDGRRAFDVLRDDAGAAAGDDPRLWLANLHAALLVAGSDRADYVVRNLVGIDVEQGLVAIAGRPDTGDRVMFVRRDRESAARDLERMLASLKARAVRPAKAGLYFSCVARGPNLFPEQAHELRAIQKAFGDIPIAGFFGNGEIAHDRVYGYTGVLTLFT